MERVSIVLGHSSIKVTEKHYSPWVRARQEQLERMSGGLGKGAAGRRDRTDHVTSRCRQAVGCPKPKNTRGTIALTVRER